MTTQSRFAIIGAGLAGCECALALACAGLPVTLFEQKPVNHSAAHVSASLAELVCSNSLRSDDPASAIGLLHNELRALGSAVMAAADACAVPADRALAVDREEFSRLITSRVESASAIRLVRREITSLDDPELVAAGPDGIVVSAGPLVSDRLAASLGECLGAGYCYFYDAIAPIVWTDSLDMEVVFRASRHSEGEGDYLNCPFTREEYDRFYDALLAGQTYAGHAGESERHFGGCMPIEALARAGRRTLAFGPLKPVGLVDPKSGKRPFAVLQLRAEQREGATCNLVGCQTKLLQGEQQRIFRLVPGLGQAEFCRYGSMHRNTYVNAPATLNADLSLKAAPGIYLAGQITGVEGYVESAATGLWLGLLLAARAHGREVAQPPADTALGALLRHLATPVKDFQPSNVNFGLMPGLDERANKKERKNIYASRAQTAFALWHAQERENLGR
ncbi:MAG: methylenetetrahydrofolate--tRNA-(uracil(54)-C(5))-methyltransferase (FADH(2)-oxidizing) TrmFO [Desulfovibrio sp.]|nr:methylenetetrahydrofolate--tRNA-(uracil(54)-C(5))-methyltransferase (FADH(2)-oxidizing) TrmFO [Desulfovibrio sp.]